MYAYQKRFIEFAIAAGALQFGSFTLKSGRTSPYFFNAGLFNSGEKLRLLGGFYAAALEHWDLDFDMLYGPAYKGIPLVCATAIALAAARGGDFPYAFNRKEAKDHGEGGMIVGAPLKGRVLILDDVITTGISVQESVALIHQAGAIPCGVLIALDRQEKTTDGLPTPAAIGRDHGLQVEAITTMEDVIAYLEENKRFHRELEAIHAYRKRFGT